MAKKNKSVESRIVEKPGFMADDKFFQTRETAEEYIREKDLQIGLRNFVDGMFFQGIQKEDIIDHITTTVEDLHEILDNYLCKKLA